MAQSAEDMLAEATSAMHRVGFRNTAESVAAAVAMLKAEHAEALRSKDREIEFGRAKLAGALSEAEGLKCDVVQAEAAADRSSDRWNDLIIAGEKEARIEPAVPKVDFVLRSIRLLARIKQLALREQIEGEVVLVMHRDKAQRIQQGLADAACWMTGYSSGAKETILGHDCVRDANLALKRAIDREDDGAEYELPF